MIVRILVVDPNDSRRTLCYQMPDHSREKELFEELLDLIGADHVTVETRKPKCQVAQLDANTIL